MRILIIRHGDPDYEHDSLTERGFKEADALAETLGNMNISKIFVSPLGRAKRTAAPTAAKLGIEPVELDWLREFPAGVHFCYRDFGIDSDETAGCPWNMLPQFWTKRPELYSPEAWSGDPIYADGKVARTLETVRDGWNSLTAGLGYNRVGQLYDIAEDADEDGIIALFCHLGLGNALLSEITGGSLPFFWQTFFLPTSSVTTVYTEKYRPFERQCFMRIIGLGDVSHLSRLGIETSSSGLHSNIYSSR